MDVPFSEVAEQFRLLIKGMFVYQIPINNGFVCIAAIGGLQRSKFAAGIPNRNWHSK
jgi:hypothetical protein